MSIQVTLKIDNQEFHNPEDAKRFIDKVFSLSKKTPKTRKFTSDGVEIEGSFSSVDEMLRSIGY